MTADPKKRGLGRGLDALFRDIKTDDAGMTQKPLRADEMLAAAKTVQPAPGKAAATGMAGQGTAAAQNSTAAQAASGNGARKIGVEKLMPGKFQPRSHFDEGALQQLSESIAVHGILQPLLVRPILNGKFEIIAGERRWRAAQKAKLHEVPVVVQELTDKQALEIALIENLQREDLSAVEEAEGYQRLMDEFGHTQEMLSQQIGKSRSHVANTLRLLKLPPAVRAMVQNGSLSAGHARALVGAKNAEELADAIVKRGLSVRDAEKLAQAVQEGKTQPKKGKKTQVFAQKNVDILALEQKMTSQLGLNVHIETMGSKAGRLTVEYKTLEQLDDVLKRLAVAPKKSA